MLEPVLKPVDLEFFQGQASVLIGPSGSGKTTLLSILGCLLAPSEGQLLIENGSVNFSDKSSLTEVRRQKLGFIFQHAQLLPFLTIEENLALIGLNAGMHKDDVKQRLENLLGRLELLPMRLKYPSQLSGGQRQRVAIARALLHRPSIVLADEPTAALDWNTGKTVVELLLEQARREQAVLVVVTHDTRMLPLFDRILSIADGILTEQQQIAEIENKFYTKP
jgi:putative ABC transport system ATP-binding protein